MAGMTEQLTMAEEEFRLLRQLVYEYCGIFFQDEVRYIFEKRLSERLQQQGLCSFGDYYRFLRHSPQRAKELEQIVDLLTTNETYFFREAYQLKAFTDEILPEVIERRSAQKRLRVWSAGCSSGEEAYTIAMLLMERQELKGWNIEVFANDISRRVIQAARRGVYARSSFRSIDEYFWKKYFRPLDGRWQIVDEVKALVSFGHLNLLDQEMLELIGAVDVIFCRNVLIYFDKASRVKVVKTFYQKLEPGGYLLLGHSESLLNISTDFELVHLKNDMVYRKPQLEGKEGREK
jgi:chemotaxis protein methyltransferase CheR